MNFREVLQELEKMQQKIIHYPYVNISVDEVKSINKIQINI